MLFIKSGRVEQSTAIRTIHSPCFLHIADPVIDPTTHNLLFIYFPIVNQRLTLLLLLLVTAPVTVTVPVLLPVRQTLHIRRHHRTDFNITTWLSRLYYYYYYCFPNWHYEPSTALNIWRSGPFECDGEMLNTTQWGGKWHGRPVTAAFVTLWAAWKIKPNNN